MRDELIARVSHELRNPLGAVIGFSLLLLERADKLDATQIHQLNQIHFSAQHMLALVKDLSMARDGGAPSDGLALQPLDLPTVAAEAAGLLAVDAAAMRVSIEIDGPLHQPFPAMADALRTRQILINLVSNAIKYNRPGGGVHITFGQAHRRRWIAIEDGGVGIAADQFDHVFAPFQRALSASASVPGTGLGLNIYRGLARSMDGEISFQSELGVGSRFVLTLPSPP